MPRTSLIFPYLLILPAALLVFVVALYPMLYGIYLSVHASDILAIGDFVGLSNYRQLLGDPLTWWNLGASLIFVFGSVFLAVAFGLGLALLLNERLVFRGVFRAAIILPWVISQVVAAMVWRWLLNADYGPVSAFFTGLGFVRLDPLADSQLAMVTLILANVWRSVAFPMVLLLAALQGIPENLYRAARVDGISWGTTLFRITIPMLRPTLMTCVIILTLSDFNIVALPLILTGGGPVDATDVISLRLYREAFSYYHMSTAAAISIILFMINIAITVLYLRIMKTRR